MNAKTTAQTAASIILLTITVALIACYLTACSSLNAEAVVNPITGSARVSIKATK